MGEGLAGSAGVEEVMGVIAGKEGQPQLCKY
jgi:hypothetical protein